MWSFYNTRMIKQLLVLCAVLGTVLSAGLQCKDGDGNDVDWYVAYKVPQDYSSSSSLMSGKEFMFITSESIEQGWTISKKTMTDNTNMMARTIENMYKDSDEEMWLVYNDEAPIESREDSAFQGLYSTAFGHTKGVVGANSEGGFWLIHSIPKFPSLESYEYPRNALRYGQSVLCISMSVEELDKVGNAFKFNAPDFEKKQLSDKLGATFPTLKEASEGGKAKKAPWYNTFDITSRGGVSFQTFAKGKSFGKDLYEWVAAALDTDMYAETWQNEPRPLPASCSIARKVMNIHEIQYKPANLSFKSSKDHSKWAISASSKKPFVCIGDINRAEPQERRGGGTVCVSNNDLWKSYNNIINNKDSC